MNLDTLIFANPPSPAEAAKCIWTHGGICFPQFVGLGRCQQIIGEMARAFDLDQKLNSKKDCGNGAAAIIPRSILEERRQSFPGFISFLNDMYLQEIGRIYFELPIGEEHTINNHVEIEENTTLGMSVGALPHADRVPALKMILYLQDVDRNSGATFIYPGTHLEMRRRFRQQLRIDPNPLNLLNHVPVESLPPRPFIEAPMGTLILVDTMAIHGGGEMKEKKVRRSIRATTWKQPLVDSYFDPKIPEALKHEMTLPDVELYHPYERKPAPIAEDLLYRED